MRGALPLADRPGLLDERTPANPGSAPTLAAAALSALAWCQPPRLAPAALAGLYGDIRERAAQDIVKVRRALAVLAQGAVEQRWISQADIGQALAAPHPHLALNTLLGRILDALCRWLWETALSHVPPAAAVPDARRAPFLLLDVASGFDRDKTGVECEDDHLIITGTCQWDFRFRLDQLPLPLARALYQALRLLACRVGEALMTDDLVSMDWLHEELLDTYRQLQEAGVTDDPAAALEILERLGESEHWGVESVQDMAHLLRQMEAIAGPPPAWTAPEDEAQPPAWAAAAPDSAARLLARVWAWRRTRPDLYRHPWAGFVRRVATVVRRFYRRKPPALAEEVEVEQVPEEDVPLAYSCYIGCGGAFAELDAALERRTGGYQSWEDHTLQGILQMMAEAGEEPRRRLRLSAETLPEVLWHLEGLATMAGLLLSAEHIQGRLEQAPAAEAGDAARDDVKAVEIQP